PVGKHIVQDLRDLTYPGFRSLTDMAARMKIIIIPRRILHSFQIVGHRLPGKFPEILFGGAGVQRIRRMGNDPAEMMLSCQLKKFLYIFLIDLLSLPASGISRKKSDGVPAVGDHLASHVFISFGRSRMISDVQHFCLSLSFYLTSAYCIRLPAILPDSRSTFFAIVH